MWKHSLEIDLEFKPGLYFNLGFGPLEMLDFNPI